MKIEALKLNYGLKKWCYCVKTNAFVHSAAGTSQRTIPASQYGFTVTEEKVLE